MGGSFSIGWVVGLLAVGLGGRASAQPPHSPAALVADPCSNLIYVAEYGGSCLVVFDSEAERLVRKISLEAPPTGVAISPGGERLFVTLDGPHGRLVGRRADEEAAVWSVGVGYSPNSPVVSPAGDRIYVCNRFTHDISVIDVRRREEIGRIPVIREPVAAALSVDGRYLYVANHLPEGRSTDAVVAARISVIDTRSLENIGSVELPDGSTDVLGIAVSPDGEHVYVTHILARYQLPTTQVERGWINTNALTIIDAHRHEYQNTVLLDSVDRGAANPWGVACSDDGRWIVVAQAGTHDLSVIDRPRLHQRLAEAERGVQVTDSTSSAADVVNDLSFLHGLRERLALQGKGPRALCINRSTAFVAEYFSNSVGIVELTSEGNRQSLSVPLGPSHPESLVRRGEFLFHDASLCFQNWQSCASCHPGQARVDGLNWDLLNDGTGNPKNAKSLLFSHQTPPAMISGVRETAEAAVRAGMQYIFFTEYAAEDAAALDAYLKSLRPLPSPWLIDGKLSEAAKRGRKKFQKAGCGDCHHGPYFTDRQRHWVGTGTGSERMLALDTPTLIETWRTAPYLHDGRAATMEEVFTQYNPRDQHGVTSSLTDREISELVAYILSL